MTGPDAPDTTGNFAQSPLPSTALRADWVTAMANLLATLQTERFPSALRQVIELCCPFNSMLITRYEGLTPPQSLYHDLDDVQAAISVRFYASGPYLLDPLYQACRNRRAPGVYRLAALTPDAFFRSEYFRTFYRNIRVSDELGILIEEAPERWIVVSLARKIREPLFSDQDLAGLTSLYELLTAAIRKNWPQSGAAGPDLDTEHAVADRLESFGADLLSPREAEIVRLILQGHSTPSAAALLGISEGTVKVHRHHAYAKLGINSQAELFSRATQYLISSQS